MDEKQITAVLKQIQHNRLFYAANAHTPRWVLQQPGVQLCMFKSGATVYDPHNFQRCLGILLEGKLQVSKQAQQDKQVVISHLLPGHLFGAAALFHEQPEYVTHIQALVRCRVLMLPQEVLFAILQKDAQVLQNYLQYLSTRIYFLNRKIDALAQGTAEGRLALHLLAATQGDSACNTVELAYPMAALAQVLGISRASLYRAMQSLQQQGWIDRQGRQVQIHNPQALRLLL